MLLGPVVVQAPVVFVDSAAELASVVVVAVPVSVVLFEVSASDVASAVSVVAAAVTSFVADTPGVEP